MNNLKFIGLLLTLISLASCSDDSVTTLVDVDADAIVATADANFVAGAHSVITTDEDGTRMALNDLLPGGSDVTIAAYGSNFYRIERAFAGNNVTKFSTSDPQTPIWQYSTNDANSAVLSNPHDMVFVSETKAYVLRYGTSTMWVVNPSAETEAEFKTGEIDLSAYDGVDGVPEMDGGVVVGDRLFITMQRLDGFAATQNAYVAIFDVTTDEEIDANIAGDSLKGIPLQIRNPGTIVYEPVSNSIFVQGLGSYNPEYTGGIVQIDLNDYKSTVVLDDGDDIDHPYGLISELAVVTDTLLYFVGYDDFSDNTLYRLDLATAEITPTSVATLLNGQIGKLTVDSDGLLWVCDSANATVRIIDPETDSEVDAVFTNLNPLKIVFAE